MSKKNYFILTALCLTPLALPAISDPVDQPEVHSGIFQANMDASVRPQDNFFQYINGTWLKQNEIPADKFFHGALMELFDKSEEDIRAIIEAAGREKNPKPGSTAQQIGDFYQSYMDEARLEHLGIEPLRTHMDRIAAIKDTSDLPSLMAYLDKIGIETPFSVLVRQDEKASTRYALYLEQSGLTLPDRDYYFNEDEKSKSIRDQFLTYMETCFTLAGHKNGAHLAKQILQLETRLAEHHWTRVQNRDRDQTYHAVNLAKLKALSPAFSWDDYFKAAGIPTGKAMVVRQPSYFEGMNGVLKVTDVAVWQTYFTWKLIDANGSRLSKAFVDANFQFYGTTLRGSTENQPRWKRAVNGANQIMGELVGKAYVAKHFKPEAKERMLTLVANLKQAFRQRVEGLDWMSKETKAAALEKLSQFNAKIGYPDRWKDYSDLRIEAGDLVGNYVRANTWSFEKNIQKLEKPIDRGEWFMNPQQVNAYYNPSLNEIVFPAAILQPPFFNMAADDAVNYGGIGAVIGHEITHGFDDQGRKSDGLGNLRDWWTEKDAQEFNARAKKMVDQYNGYEPLPENNIQGELTLGENIGDLGGLTVAYYAYRNTLKGQPSPVLDGFTGEQRVFIGWAQIWRGKYREAALRQQLKTNPHSPGKYRVLGVVANMPEFYRAFDVKPGDGMYRDKEVRVKIW